MLVSTCAEAVAFSSDDRISTGASAKTSTVRANDLSPKEALVNPSDDPSTPSDQAEQSLFDFADAEALREWAVVNDTVMGGVSESEIRFEPDTGAVFQGHVSLENSGGFASVRSGALDHGFEEHHAIQVRVRGDGKRYKLTLREGGAREWVLFERTFETRSGEWIVVDLPFHEFVPTYRGNVLNDQDPLDPERVRTVGFLISEKQQGPFRLEIRSIQIRQ
jgi:monofunctional biosynthetic peptidoglycan transglycosylase